MCDQGSPDISRILNTTCVCHQPTIEGQWYRDRGFIAQGTGGHIVMCNPDVMKDAPDKLKTLWSFGFKHRPGKADTIMSAAVRESVLNNIRDGLAELCEKHKHIHNNSTAMQFWVDCVVDQIEKQLHTNRFADGRVFNCTSKSCEPGTYSPSGMKLSLHTSSSCTITSLSHWS